VPYPQVRLGKIAQDITVLIDGSDSFGSGVLITREGDDYMVLTSEHVVKEIEKSYEVVTPDGKRYPIANKSIRKLPNLDLAILKFKSSKSYKLAKITNSNNATLGTQVFTSGFPAPGQAIRDRLFQFTSGEISGRPEKAQQDGYALIYTNVTRRGMSGGPVLNANGQLVGVHGRAETDSLGDESFQVKAGLNLGIPINTFMETASKLGIKISANSEDTNSTASNFSETQTKVSSPSVDSSNETSSNYMPSFIPTRPKVLRPNTSGVSAPICAGNQC
jgi:serine protease Do